MNDPTERSLPNIQILGAFQLGNAPNDKNETTNNNFYLSDTISLSRGRHNLRFGAEIFRNRFVTVPTTRTERSSSFPFPIFCLVCRPGPPGGGNGTPLSNVYLASRARRPEQRIASAAAHFFAADDWKVSDTLTINLGFRLEANGQQKEAQGQLANFDPSSMFRHLGAVLLIPPRRDSSCQTTTKGKHLKGFRARTLRWSKPLQLHPQPRLGVAWKPSSSHDIVVRAGYGCTRTASASLDPA